MEGVWNHLEGTWRETPAEGSDDGRNEQRDDDCIYEQWGNVSRLGWDSDGLLSQHSHNVLAPLMSYAKPNTKAIFVYQAY